LSRKTTAHTPASTHPNRCSISVPPSHADYTGVTPTPNTLASQINNVTAQTLTYAPIALNAVTSIEAAAAHLPGTTKSQIAVNMILAGATAAEGVPVPSVQAAAALVSLFVGILNATHIFSHRNAQASAQLAAQAGILGGVGFGGSISSGQAQAGQNQTAQQNPQQ
jgi:hypothetical protein